MSVTTSDAFVAAAESIATIAHQGQVDKLGADYIDHPRRVSENFTDPLARATAWLHDVLEDTDISPSDLLAAGIPGGVVEAVHLLTRTDEVSDSAYYAAIRANPIALAVKRADIADNLAGWRVAQLASGDRERLADKYAGALAALG